MSIDNAAELSTDAIKQCTAILRRFLTSPIPLNAFEGQRHHQVYPTIPWSQLWKLLNIFDNVVAVAQADLVEKARDALEHQQSTPEVKAKLEHIAANDAAEHERYFSLSVYWRRAAVWQQLREKPADIEAANDMLEQYLVSDETPPIRARPEACQLRPTTAAEAKLLAETTMACRRRLHVIRNWLSQHPAVVQMLRDPKGKGKARETPEVVSAFATDAVRTQTSLQTQRLVQSINELADPRGLADLASATADWLDAFEHRWYCVETASTNREPKATFPAEFVPPTNNAPEQLASLKTSRQSDHNYEQMNNASTPPLVPHVRIEALNSIVKDFQETQGSDQSQSQKSWQETPPSPESLPSPPPAAQTRRANIASHSKSPQSQVGTRHRQLELGTEPQPEREDSSLELPPLLSSVPSHPVQDCSQETIASAFTTTTTTQTSSTSKSALADTTHIRLGSPLSVSANQTAIAKSPSHSFVAGTSHPQPSLLQALSPDAEARLVEAATAAQQRLTGIKYDPWDDIQWEVPTDTDIHIPNVENDFAALPATLNGIDHFQSPIPCTEDSTALETDLSVTAIGSHACSHSDTNSETDSAAPLPTAPDVQHDLSLTSLTGFHHRARTVSSNSNVEEVGCLDQRVRDFLKAAVVD